MTKQSLKQLHPRAYDVPIALMLSFLALIFGLFLPVITFKEMVFWKHTFSVLTGILSLMTEGHYILGCIILIFSLIFPLLKLVVLFFIWFRRLTDGERQFYVQGLSILGKWSMLDVFVVAITIVIAKISNFASAHARMGIYFFGFSIALAIATTMRIEQLMKKELRT